MQKRTLAVITVLIFLSFSLSVWSFIRLNALEAENSRMLTGYRDLAQQVNVRYGAGTDSLAYITPDDPQVAALVGEITDDFTEDGYWRECKKLYRWVAMNVAYSHDSPLPLLPDSPEGSLEWGGGFWNRPAETIESGIGDCEDMSALLASLLLNYNGGRYPVWVIGVRNFAPVPVAHVAVAMPFQNDLLAIWDPASRYYTPFADIDDMGQREITLALELWFGRIADKVPDPRIYVAFTDGVYLEFGGTEEFVAWVTESY